MQFGLLVTLPPRGDVVRPQATAAREPSRLAAFLPFVRHALRRRRPPAAA